MSERQPVEHTLARNHDGAALSRLKELFSTLVELPLQDREAFLWNVADAEVRDALRGLLRADSVLAAMTARSAVQSFASAHADAEHAFACVDGFAIQRMLGRGGMGTVYLAERAVPGGLQRIALKCLYPIGAAADFERRFHSEISVLAQLSHPHIARLIDAGQEADGRCWIAMEFIEGVPLLQYCDERNLPVAARLTLFETLCEAVSAAHRNLIVHRDLKSSNVLVREDGELFLLDFGIARTLSAVSDVTQPEQRFLSPLNAAPEQVRGEATTTSCDVYGLGVILYELLCGAPPIGPQSHSGEAVREAVLHQIPPLASARLRQLSRSAPKSALDIARRRACTDSARLARNIRGDLEQVCAVALRKQPHERYASVEQLLEDLRRAVSGQPILARGNDRLYRSTRWLGRNALAVTFAAAATIALMTGLAVLWLQASNLEVERDHARGQTQLAQQRGQRAEFLNALLLDAFDQADPSRTMGASLTVKQVLDAGVRRLHSTDEVDADSRIQLATALADIEYRLGLYADGDSLVDFSRERLAELPHPAPRLIAQQHFVEGVRAKHDGRWHDALQRAEAGLASIGTIDDASSQRLWLELSRMRADGHWALDDYPGAFALYRELIAASERLHWSRRTDVWDLRIWFATALEQTADTRLEARSILNQVLKEQADAHADDTPSNGMALRTLATAELDSGNADLSLQYAQKAVAIYQRAYGDRHPALAWTLGVLADAEAKTGQPQLAVQHFQQALSIADTAGAQGGTSAVEMYKLGTVYDEGMNDYARAEHYYRAALGAFQLLLGDEHSNCIVAELGIATLMIKQQRYAEADPLLEHALHSVQKVSTYPDHLSSIRAAMAIVRHSQGRDAEAKYLLQTSLSALRRYALPDNYILRRALSLAEILHVS